MSITTRNGNETESVMCVPTGTCRLKPLPAKRRSLVRASHNARSASVGLRRSSRASPRTRPRFAIFREQRAQGRGFLSVEHAAACGPLAAFGQRNHDAVQGLDVLLARLHAREDVAPIDQHRGALVQRPKIFDSIELALEICEKSLHLLLAGRFGFPRHGEGKHAAGCKLEPFVGDKSDSLSKVKR